MKVLEIKFEGWTATPRMPFILSGNAVSMSVPSYSIILGIIGCCLGRPVEASEVNIGYHYSFDQYAKDIETRHRLEFDGRKVKPNSKGSDAYVREFHTFPRLILWINRTDWKEYFQSPVGTPVLGQSQDLLKVVSVEEKEVNSVEKAVINGCMLPFVPGVEVNGQLLQLVESFRENGIGEGRTALCSRIFVAIPTDVNSEVIFPNLWEYECEEGIQKKQFYLHDWS